MKFEIAVLPGDGIGPEVVEQALRVLSALGERFGHRFVTTSHAIGGAAIDAHGTPLPDATLAACRRAAAVLLGAVGGPKWDRPQATIRPEQGLLGLRKGLGLFANLRPLRVRPALIDASPLRPERLSGVDLLVVRELTGGLYFGEPRYRTWEAGVTRAVDTLEYTDAEIARVVRLAMSLARERRGRVTSVDKANVLETSRLWRQTTEDIAAEFGDVTVDHQLVDAAAMRLVSQPADFDVIVTSNMFGDILTDEASVLAGSLGLLPSASLRADSLGLYEPIHGSAPDIAGRGIANPVGMIASVAMMLRHSCELPAEAEALERAIDVALASGARTADIGGDWTTAQVADSVIEVLAKARAA